MPRRRLVEAIGNDVPWVAALDDGGLSMAGGRVTTISWERINLTMVATLDEAPSGDVQFRLVEGNRRYPVATERLSTGDYRLTINVTNFHQRRQVPNGTWRVVPIIDGEPGVEVDFDLDDLPHLDDRSRVFLYDNNQVAYVVAFAISEDEAPKLLIRTYQLFRSAKSTAKPPRTVRARAMQRALPKARRIAILNRWYRLCRKVSPPSGNRILFASEMRGALGGNLLRVRDRMVERGLDQRYTLRYSFREPRAYSRGGTLRLTYLLATSDIVLIDDYFGLFDRVKPAPGTKVIQLWHAGSGFKNIGYSRFGNYGSPKLRNPHRAYTYAITGSEHLVPVYAEAFGIEESAVIPTGLPRLDHFLDPAMAEQARAGFFSQHPHLVGKRLVLFAPTFRGRGATRAFYDYSLIDFEALHRMCGDDTVVLFRAHHFVPPPVPIPPEYSDRILDVTSYPDVNTLLRVTDVLVTDYSSIIYEFSLLDRPMVFFAPDRRSYSATRGFHRNFDEVAPGKICDTIDDVVKAIESDDFEQWKVERFRRENVDHVDSRSADRVIDWLILGEPPATGAVADSPGGSA